MNRKKQAKIRHRSGFVPELIYAWRIAPYGDWSRFLLAFMIATTGFASAAMLVRVKGMERSSRMDERGTAQVVIIRPDDVASRELLDWAREQSPFPDRWQPEFSQALSEEIALIDNELIKSSRYQPKLLPSDGFREEMKTPELLGLWQPELPVTAFRAKNRTAPETPQEVRVVVSPDESLSERWRPLEASWSGLDYYKLLGKKAEFVVGVDDSGKVNFCLASNGFDSLLDHELQGWLRGHALKPVEDQGEVQWATVTVSVLAASEEGVLEEGGGQ